MSKLNILQELTNDINKCSLCDLCGRGSLVEGFDPHVPPRGNPDAKIMFVAESPGIKEAELKVPLTPPGKSGQVYERILAYLGLSREEVWTTNVVSCHPPENRDPEPLEIYKCAPYLERQLELVKPKLVVSFGRFAATYFLGNIKITRDHGKVQFSTKFKVDVFPLSHPAYIRAYATQEQKKGFKEDVESLKDILINRGIINVKSDRAGVFKIY